MMAEYGWGLTEELRQKAVIELNEHADERELMIDAVRDQIETRPDIDFLRTDDAFILRFLRARKFNTFEAFKTFARYFEYRRRNPNLFRHFHASEAGIKESLLDGLPGVLEGADQDGRRILVMYSANWDIKHYGLAAIYRALLLTLERLVQDEATQINGVVVVVDWSQCTFTQSTWLKPNILRLIIEGLQDCFPVRISGIHFVNQPWYIEAIFKVIRPFLKDKNKNKMFMHGVNLSTLHESIHKEALPAELGGLQAPYNNHSWARQLIGDESFSFGDSQIYWPSNCIKKRSETFPLDKFSSETSPGDSRGIQLDEEIFLSTSPPS